MRSNNIVEKESKLGISWIPSKRYVKLNIIKNELSYFHKYFSKPLNQVMTFKECEVIYQLPPNTVIQDYNNNRLNKKHVRKSYSTYLITMKEAEKQYRDYWTQRALYDNKHLYTELNGNKMTETEYLIKYGNKTVSDIYSHKNIK